MFDGAGYVALPSGAWKALFGYSSQGTASGSNYSYSSSSSGSITVEVMIASAGHRADASVLSMSDLPFGGEDGGFNIFSSCAGARGCASTDVCAAATATCASTGAGPGLIMTKSGTTTATDSYVSVTATSDGAWQNKVWTHVAIVGSLANNTAFTSAVYVNGSIVKTTVISSTKVCITLLCIACAI